MKSRTSFFEKTVFHKNLTRFAPAWGAYLVILLLALVSMADRPSAYYRVQNLRDAIIIMSWVNLIYAAVVAQLIFGDLFTSRMCNALHALPLRRETWFCTHVVSGVACSCLPNLALALLALPVMRLEAAWSAVFWWLLASELQYLFFFGIAVFCVMLSGNRLGQLALYGMLQFGGVISYWLVSSVYEPFLHGIQFSELPFAKSCPMAYLAEYSDILVIDYARISNAAGDGFTYQIYGVAPGDGWGYMGICALVGLLALLCALVLYRHRKLECAGDFVAFDRMQPAVTVIATVFAGVVFHVFADSFGMNLRSVMLGGGMVIGFFGCRMLLERTTRVFRKKTFLFCGSILAVFGLTVLLTYLDPAGVTRYIPKAEDVESITFSQSYSLSSHSEFPYTATSPEDIAALQRVHALGITKESAQPDGGKEMYNGFNIRLEYKLKNGKTVNRFYDIYPTSEAGVILKDYFTTTECVLGVPAEKIQTLTPHIRSLFIAGYDEVLYDLDNLDIPGLLEAVAADCAAGNMAQMDGYHYPSNYDLLGYSYEEIDDIVFYLEIGWDREWIRAGIQAHPDAGYDPMPTLRYKTFRVYRSCENTISWMEENGLVSEEMQQELIEKFGGPTVYFETDNG